MALLARIPPGRSGRIWLHRRLVTAQNGRNQLDRKLRVLLPEQQRLRINAQRCHRDWAAACESARTWSLRAAILGGQDALRGAAPPHPAEVDVVWSTAMGLRYPSDVTLHNQAGDAAFSPGNAAVEPAVAAFHDALIAGLRTAAAEEAVRRIEAEIAVTRRRLRALDRRWLPRLQDALARLDLSLEEAEREDGARLRRAAAATADRRPLP